MALIEVDEKLNKGQRQQQEQQTNIKHYEIETQNIMVRIQTIHPEMADLSASIAGLEEQIAHKEAEVATFQSRRDSLEQQVERFP